MLRLAFEIDDKRIIEKYVATRDIATSTEQLLDTGDQTTIEDTLTVVSDGIEHIIVSDGTKTSSTYKDIVCKIPNQEGLYDGSTSLIISTSPYTLLPISETNGVITSITPTTAVYTYTRNTSDYDVVLFQSVVLNRHKVIINDGENANTGVENEVWL